MTGTPGRCQRRRRTMGETPERALLERVVSALETCKPSQVDSVARNLRREIDALPQPSHCWVPIAECGELADGDYYVRNPFTEGLARFESGKLHPDSVWDLDE